MRKLRAVILGIGISILLAVCSPAWSAEPGSEATVNDVPDSFPKFSFAGHEREADLLSRYLWYHFTNRLGNSPTLFNKEYLTVSDLWMGGAIDKRRHKSIQDVHREDLMSIKLDSSGYVHTHQHFSHAHDHGWPFPLWSQSSNGPDGVVGRTAGWHFQETGPNWIWIWGFLKAWNRPQYFGETAAQGWKLRNVTSLGIVDDKWRLKSAGNSPSITTPAGMEIEAFQAPFLQLRWTRSGEPKTGVDPYIEWLREEDSSFGADRRVYFTTGSDEWVHTSGAKHSMIEMHRHPKWTGKIKQMRLNLAPGESDVEFAIDSFFTVYDTRHPINNPIFIFSCLNYYNWTGDLSFLRANINRMRTALRHQQTEMGGLEHNHIRNSWPGHDGLPGWTVNPDGSKTFHGGHGIGNNYYDLLPFGWDDMFATAQYYAATLAMADIEEAILANPGWGMPLGSLAFDPQELRKHAAAVKNEANRKFWDREKGRFIGSIDVNGRRWDYGFTFVNLEAIWYDIASERNARQIMDWIGGKRIVAGDTSTGEDIYHWRFGPRATTKRNIEWYGQGWNAPESLPWGAQIQDGGAVLGFAFYDLWARLHVNGPNDAWERLMAVLEWEDEVLAAGGYREYYKDGKQGTTLQGGGTAGGIGVDNEFFESSMIPSIIVYGFLGLEPRADSLAMNPRLPDQCPEIGISNVLYRNAKLDIKASSTEISIQVKDRSAAPIRLRLAGDWRLTTTGRTGSTFDLAAPRLYTFERVAGR